MAELVSQQSSSPVYRAACELGAYRLRAALADKPVIEYDKTGPEELVQCLLPEEVASITVASAVDGSCAMIEGSGAPLSRVGTSPPWLKRCGLEAAWSRPWEHPFTHEVFISFVAPLVLRARRLIHHRRPVRTAALRVSRRTPNDGA